MAVYSVESVKGLDHVQVVYTGKDNPIEVIFKLDDVEYDYSGAKLIKVKIGTVEFDSTSDAGAFDRSESAIGKLRVFIGDLPNIAAQAYNVKFEITDENNKDLYFGHIRVKIDDPGM